MSRIVDLFRKKKKPDDDEEEEEPERVIKIKA